MNAQPVQESPRAQALPRLDAEAQAAIRALHQAGDMLRSTQDGWQLELRTDAPAHAQGEGMRLTHAMGELLLVMRYERDIEPLGEVAWQDFPGEARVLAWTLAHEPLLTRLSQVFGQPLLPKGFAKSDDAICWIDFKLHHETQSTACEGALGLDAASVQALLAAPGWEMDAQAASKRRAKISLRCEFHLPGPELALSAVRGLKTGDVMILGSRAITLTNLRLRVPAEMRTEAACWLASLTQAGLTLTRKMEAHEMTNQTPSAETTPEQDAADAKLAQLPVRVDVVLDTLTLPLSEIERLGPGHVLPLSQKLEGARVRLRVNGAEFGGGELVAIGDALGVRLHAADKE